MSQVLIAFIPVNADLLGVVGDGGIGHLGSTIARPILLSH